MQIIVEGRGVKFITPDEVIMNFKFKIVSESYEKCLELGSNFMEEFTNNVLIKNKFKKEDLKTRSFVIKEEQEYDQISRKYLVTGYSYNQNAILRFSYDIKKMSSLVKDASIYNDKMSLRIDFGVLDEEKVKNELLKVCYDDALVKASIISSSSNKKVKECTKVSFNEIESDYLSKSNIDSNMMCYAKSSLDPVDALANSFTPEDIEISNVIYCVFNAE